MSHSPAAHGQQFVRAVLPTTSRTRRRFLAALVVALVQGGACDSHKEESAKSSIPAKVQREGQDTLHRWAALLPGLAPLPSSEMACDDEELRRKHQGAPGRVLLVDRDFLARFAPPYPSQYLGKYSFWRLLTHPKLRRLDVQALATGGPRFTEAMLAAREISDFADYWGVVLSTARLMPQAEDGGYYPGRLDGWLVVLDPNNGRRICQTSFAVGSSVEVAGLTRNAQSAVERDWALQIRRELDSSIGRISRQLVLVTD